MSDDNWKKTAAARRDERNAKDAPVSHEETKTVVGKRKDTKRWCKGKEGVEHELECMRYNSLDLFGKWRVLACKKCGKRMKTYYGFRSEDKPDWVTF